MYQDGQNCIHELDLIPLLINYGKKIPATAYLNRSMYHIMNNNSVNGMMLRTVARIK